jgi:hypothetical protein
MTTACAHVSAAEDAKTHEKVFPAVDEYSHIYMLCSKCMATLKDDGFDDPSECQSRISGDNLDRLSVDEELIPCCYQCFAQWYSVTGQGIIKDATDKVRHDCNSPGFSPPTTEKS